MQKIKLLIFIILFSCGNIKDILDKTKYKFQVKKTIKIKLDTLTKNLISSPQVIGNEIVFFNPQINALQFYDITQKEIKLSRKIKFSYEGENGVSGISNFLIHNEDSIFLLAPYAYKVFLMNKKSEIKQTYKLINGKIGENTAMPNPLPFYNPLILVNNKIHISARPDRNSMAKEFYDAKTLSIEVDIRKNKFEYMYGYPDLYKKNIYPVVHSMCTRVYSEKHKKFVYNFFADNNIHVTDQKNNHAQHYAGYSNLKEIPSLPKYITDNEENNKKGNEMPVFIGLRYDKYRDIFLRELNMKANEQAKQNYSVIIILNGNFEKIGEIVIPFKKGKANYSFLNSFFTPDGMYIQKIDPQEKEGVLVYDLVEWVKE